MCAYVTRCVANRATRACWKLSLVPLCVEGVVQLNQCNDASPAWCPPIDRHRCDFHSSWDLKKAPREHYNCIERGSTFKSWFMRVDDGTRHPWDARASGRGGGQRGGRAERGRDTPNLPTKIIPTKIAWLKHSGNVPWDKRIPPLKLRSLCLSQILDNPES